MINNLALALFMFGILAAYIKLAIPFDDLAARTNLFY
jgi:hypothetical protein